MSGRPPVLIWTRDPGARQIVPLVLGRIAQPFERCSSAWDLLAKLRAVEGAALLVLGPSFTSEDAQMIRQSLEGLHDVLVVLLEDVTLPQAPAVCDRGVLKLRLPVRPRTLVGIIGDWAA